MMPFLSLATQIQKLKHSQQLSVLFFQNLENVFKEWACFVKNYTKLLKKSEISTHRTVN